MLEVSFVRKCEGGGIGRRTGLRNQRLVHGGSSPPSRTTLLLGHSFDSGKIRTLTKKSDLAVRYRPE